MANELVRVEFHGDWLEAVKDEAGKVWVSLRRGSENLGVDFSAQLAKLRGKPWACMGEITTRDAAGRQQTLTMIDLDTLPGWLFSIDARKVKEEIREKLARYQREAARVLADHFYGRGLQVANPADFAETVRQLIAQELDRRLTKPAAPLALPGSSPTIPQTTVAERLRWKGWLPTSPKQRAAVRNLANWLLKLRHEETPDRYADCGPCIYHGHQIACLDEAIDRTREEYRRKEAERGRGIFDDYRG